MRKLCVKILVLSDSHGRGGKLKNIISANADADAIIYLGDGEADLEKVKGFIAPETAIYRVMGNCDRESSQKVVLIRNIGGINFYITHGFEQGVKYGTQKIAALAYNEGCRAALFGHTHRQHLSEFNEVVLFNPGAAANGEYGLIHIDCGRAYYEHRSL